MLTLGCISCKNSDPEINKLDIAKQYYKILDTSDDAAIAALLTDSLLTKETEYDYEQTFSLKEYIEWMKWDAVFDPIYTVIQMEQENETVKTTVSKIDKRIFFLHEAPMVTTEVIRFDHDKIISIERTEYPLFDEATFTKNRSELLSWIDKNHPELNGFIYDQTEAGAKNYLKALALYKNRK